MLAALVGYMYFVQIAFSLLVVLACVLPFEARRNRPSKLLGAGGQALVRPPSEFGSCCHVLGDSFL